MSGAGSGSKSGAKSGSQGGPGPGGRGLDAARPDLAVEWPPLTEGVLIARHHRFLADVLLPDGRTITAHTNNTGAMLECSEPGRPVHLSLHDRPGRAHPYGWEMISMPDGLVGVNTLVPNRLAHLAALDGALSSGVRPASVRREVRVGEGRSRLDLSLVFDDGAEALIEVKSSTLVREGAALFPDAVSSRGARHLRELAALADSGRRAVILVLVQRSGAGWFSPADGIDPVWGRALREAVAGGVELMVRQVDLSLARASWGRALEARLG